MIGESISNRHLEDGQLIRYIDGEVSSDERRSWEHHLASCRRCRTDVEVLRDQSATITEWLTRADFERPARDEVVFSGAAPPAPVTRRHGVPARTPARRPRLSLTDGVAWLKAAAIVLLVAAPLVAISPAREWVADRLGLAGTEQSALTGVMESAVELDATEAVVRFAPAPGGFRVTVSTAQERGAITLGRVGPGEEALFEVSGDAPRPEAVVSARGIRIDNEPSATASYTLLLPPEVTAVDVIVESHPLAVSGRDLDRRAIVPLHRRDRR